MWGGRLPAHYESVDAELHAILAYVKKMAQEGGESGENRRVLILSDCKAAIHVIQTAHDTGEARGMRHLKCGGATVEAIEHYRKKLDSLGDSYKTFLTWHGKQFLNHLWRPSPSTCLTAQIVLVTWTNQAGSRLCPSKLMPISLAHRPWARQTHPCSSLNIISS